MNQHHIFFAVSVLGGKLSGFAAVRTDEKGAVEVRFDTRANDTDAIPLVQSIENMRRKILDGQTDRYVLVSHFTGPTERIFAAACKEAGVEVPFKKGVPWGDTAQLVWPYLMGGAIESRNLEPVARYFAVECPHDRSAKDEAQIVADLYFKLMWRLSKVEGIESQGRQVFTDLVGSLFGMAGTRDVPPPIENGR